MKKILIIVALAVLLAPGTFYAWRYTLCWHFGIQAICLNK